MLSSRTYDEYEVIGMLNKLLIVAGLSLCVAACATTPPATPDASKRTAATAATPAGCVTDTGTRLPVKPGDCAAPGHVWTDQEVRGTGVTDSAHALRLLDPTVTVTGH